MKKSFSLTFIAILLSFTGFSQLQTKSVSVFKNNTSFFIKSGNVAPKESIYRLEGEIPRALFGTFWFQSPGNAIKMVSSNEENSEKTSQAMSNYEFLKANTGKKVVLTLGPTETAEGIVFSFSKDYDETTKTYFPAGFVTLRSNNLWQTIKIEDIKRISFSELPLTNVTNFEKKKVISVQFNETKSPQPLNVMYLEDGLGWSPNYLLELTSENKGILTLQAQVKNDAEDIQNSDVSFVAGNADFKDANTLAWLVDFLPQVSREESYNQPGLYYVNTASSKSAAYADVAEETPSAEGDGVEGEAGEDLFFYTLKSLNLPKSSRAQLELFRAEISFEHLYNVNLNAMPVYDLENNPQPTYGNSETGAKVYHSLKLNNQTKYPWTSGPCFVVNSEKTTKKPVSQNVLTYTPIKGDNFLKLNESPDIKVEQTEKEISRRTGIRKSRDFFYDQITVEAEIKIKNYKTKDVKISVKRMVLGELLKSSIGWKSQDKLNYGSYLNKTNDVTWESTVKAGEEITIKYSYSMIVRGN